MRMTRSSIPCQNQSSLKFIASLNTTIPISFILRYLPPHPWLSLFSTSYNVHCLVLQILFLYHIFSKYLRNQVSPSVRQRSEHLKRQLERETEFNPVVLQTLGDDQSRILLANYFQIFFSIIIPEFQRLATLVSNWLRNWIHFIPLFWFLLLLVQNSLVESRFSPELSFNTLLIRIHNCLILN